MTSRRDPAILPAREMQEARKRGRSITRTVRMDEDIDFRLVAKAERERQSVNVIINRALRVYVEWTQHAKMFEHATVSSALLEKMMNYLTADQARELGKWSGMNTLSEMTSMLFGGIRLTSIIGTLALMAKYSGRFVLEHTFENGKHYLILHHGAGLKWSQFYEQFLIAGIQNAQVKQFDVKITENQVVMSVVEPGMTSSAPETPFRGRTVEQSPY